MKKKLIYFLVLVLGISSTVYSQSNNSIDVDDEIYSILEQAQDKGYCNALSNYKPYTEAYILSVLNEISDNLNDIETDSYSINVEKEIIENQKKRFVHDVKGLDWNNLEYSFQSSNENSFSPTMFIRDYAESFFSGGVYNVSELNSFGYDIYDKFDIFGQINSFLSYRTHGYIGMSEMPLYKLGDDYFIGSWWKETNFEEQQSGPNARFINTWRNYSVIPYTYKKPWSGSVYYLTNFTASGLEGWPVEPSIAFGMEGEITGSFYDNNLIVRAGRYSHELASMDKNSSLVLNAMAQPFFGIDLHLRFNEHFSFDTITGWLEFPNQGYINANAFNDPYDSNRTDHSRGDSFYFQSMYSAKALNLDFKYFHFDLGSTCVYPKRFELGYMFPLIDCVVYQNSLGDYDNLSLFTDIKGILPGIGQIWISGYLDEMNKPNAKFWESTRCMLAYQGGIKANIPWLPFGNVSFRYTKVEPYCYTHTLLAYQPYSNKYASTSYTNNGYSLGYYMPPNSDEFLLDFNFKPSSTSSAGLTYQLARHGTDWGSGSVQGSNIYSELTYEGRASLKKYFLHDGTYEWTSTINLYGEYTFTALPIPVKLNCSLAYIYDWFTGVDNNGQKNNSYHIVNTEEYSPSSGVVMSLGVTIFGK